MNRGAALVLFVMVVAQAGQDETVLTRDGRRLIGKVRRAGESVIVATASETVQLSRGDVLAIFVTPREAYNRALARFEQAKQLFEECRALPDKDLRRKQRLVTSLDICKETRDLLELLTKFYTGPEHADFVELMRKVPQFMRLIRDAIGASFGDIGVGRDGESTKIVEVSFAFESPPASDSAWKVAGDLGEGQRSATEGLTDGDPKSRLEAAKRLASPPAPHAAGAMIQTLQQETDPEVIAALAEAIGRLDIESRLETDFDWARQDRHSDRRIAVATIVKRVGTKAACQFLLKCFEEVPPSAQPVRAAFASAFQRLRAWSIDGLKEVSARAKDPAVQIEAVKQLGMLRDRRSAETLKTVLASAVQSPGHRTLLNAVTAALEHVGMCATPELLEGLSSRNEAMRRYSKALLKRVTGYSDDDPATFARWWQQSRREVELADERHWREQEANDYPVTPEEFDVYNRTFPEPKN